MGTHPIFESDFDCLTVCTKMKIFSFLMATLAMAADTLVARIGKEAPDFEAEAVVDGDFQKVKLSAYRGKYVVFFFYPLDFTFVCPTEIIAFSDRVDEFRKIGAEVIGASVDSHFTHLAWTKTPRKEGGLGKMNIPLVSDLTKEISRNYGVLLEIKELPSVVYSLSTHRVLFDKLQSTIYPLVATLTKHFAWFRPSSTLTRMAKFAQLAGSLVRILSSPTQPTRSSTSKSKTSSKCRKHQSENDARKKEETTRGCII